MQNTAGYAPNTFEEIVIVMIDNRILELYVLSSNGTWSNLSFYTFLLTGLCGSIFQLDQNESGKILHVCGLLLNLNKACNESERDFLTIFIFKTLLP